MVTVKKLGPKIITAGGPEDLARAALEIFVNAAKKAIAVKDNFNVAISGGNTPGRFFELLSEQPKTKLRWDKTQLFWVDEHCVPPDSKGSNYKLAADTFLPKAGIPSENIHRICAECIDCKAAAHDYEDTIRKVFGLEQNQMPRFDLIVLGMGADGHTGSLFPNSYAPFEKEDLVCVVYFMDGRRNRITMTAPVLCTATHLVVLVSGEEKAEILSEVLTSEPDEVRYPIHTIWPILDKVTWLVDNDAAKLL